MKLAIRPKSGRECQTPGSYAFGLRKSRCFDDIKREQFSIAWAMTYNNWPHEPFISVCWGLSFCYSKFRLNIFDVQREFIDETSNQTTD